MIQESLTTKFDIYKNYAKELLKLTAPIFAGNVSTALIGICDAYVAGKYSTVALGAISTATAIFMTIMIAAIGLMASISPVVSNLRGKKQPAKNLFKTTIIYSLSVSLVFFLITLVAIHLVKYIGLTPELYSPTVEYLKICSYGVFGAVLFYALKEFLQAFEIVVFPNFIMILQIFLNLFLNFALVFGLWHFPSLGVKGLALASTIVRTFGAILILLYAIPFLKGKGKRKTNYICDLVKTGWPISFALFFEFLGFNVTAVLVGKFSTVYAASHAVLITIGGFIYNLPFSISNAIAIKTGFANGEGNLLSVKRYTFCGIGLGIFTMIIASVFLSLYPKQIISLFTKDIDVIQTSLPVIKVMVCYLIFDALQCTVTGTLKGIKKTKIIMYMMLISYVLVGIPIGCIFAFKFNIVLEGFWIGLAIALFCASLIATGALIKNLKTCR